MQISQHTPPRAKQLRANARKALAGQWVIAVLVTVLAALLGATVSGVFPTANINISISGSPSDLVDLLKQLEETVGSTEIITDGIWSGIGTVVAMIVGTAGAIWNELMQNPKEFLTLIAPILAILALFFAVAMAIKLFHFVLGGVIDLGLCRFRLALVDGQKGKVSMLFSAFDRLFFRALWLRILRGLYVFLWSLLFIIPGIIAAYRYSMANYALAENPEMRASDALRESARMMVGNKWRLFCLRLSFLGWHVLSVLTAGLLGLGVAPYLGQAEACFYHEVSGRAKIREMVEGLEVI